MLEERAMMLLGMAWRNLWRNPRRTLMTTAAMTLALCVMVLYSGLIRGYTRGMEQSVRDLEVGDVQIFAPGYLETPSLFATIREPLSVVQRLERAGLTASARLLAGGLGAAGDQSAGVSLRGLDVARDARVCTIGRAVAQGAWLDPGDPKGVVVGRRLAKGLALHLGSDVVVVTQGADGSLANDLYRVRGVLGPVSDATDRMAIFMTESTFRELLVMPHGAHQIIVRRPDSMALGTAEALARHAAPGLVARSWRELMPTVASMLDSTRSVVFVVFLTVYLAVGVLVLNGMLMAVFERIRELGVLKALGFGPADILWLILLESGLQTALAVTIGLLASVPGIVYLSKIGVDVGRLGGAPVLGYAVPTVWHGEYSWGSLRGPVLTLCLMVLAGVIVPAAKAALIRPISAVRHV